MNDTSSARFVPPNLRLYDHAACYADLPDTGSIAATQTQKVSAAVTARAREGDNLTLADHSWCLAVAVLQLFKAKQTRLLFRLPFEAALCFESKDQP